MTKRRTRSTRSKNTSKAASKRNQITNLSRGIGLLLIAIAALTLLSLFSLSQGRVTEWWIDNLSQGFGWGVFPIALGLGLVGGWIFLRTFGAAPNVDPGRLLGVSILLLTTFGLLHAGGDDLLLLAEEGRGGGLVGLIIHQVLTDSLGRAGMLVVLVTLAILGLVMAFDISTLAALGKLREWIAALAARIKEWQEKRAGKRQAAAEPRQLVVNPRRSEPAPQEPTAPPGPSPLAKAVRARIAALKTKVNAEPQPALILPRVYDQEDRPQWNLPTLATLLDESTEQQISQSEIRQRARTIEETLSSFGAPGRVTEVNQGPTVTQYGIEPGYVERKNRDGTIRQAKVKVNRISALGKDLELALAASPIRIEAPVPGRAMVGLEVPNSEVSVVSLRGVMESEQYKALGAKNGLAIALGRDVSGSPIVADLTAMPHLLIAGATGSGKSACINVIISCLLCTHTPDDLRMILVDPKMVEMINYNGIPHLLSPVVTDVGRVVDTLKWATREMDRRYKAFSAVGARNLAAYNEQLALKEEPPLPYIVIFIDELADIMMVAPDDAERYVCRIAQLARATGIHLVIATQRPSVDVVTGLIKANFPARISFAVTSQVDSRVVLDTPGAEQLLGNGDMLYMAPDSSKLVRAQGCYATDTELERVVRFWKGLSLDRPLPDDKALVQQPLWAGASSPTESSPSVPDQDDLLADATKLVCEQQRASISLLQRKLRIGYSRAARLIDLMEKEGIVGPSPGGSRAREVLIETPGAPPTAGG
jgi:DNA segregation ATPase FtsK/SpoIIIE, S-DNA-T family